MNVELHSVMLRRIWLVMWLTGIVIGLVISDGEVLAGAGTIYSIGPKTLFTPSYRTHDGKAGQVRCDNSYKNCDDAGSEKIIQGVKVARPCWKYSYIKSCGVYPSKNDCGRWSHCYVVGDVECLTWDSYDNCVNIKKEFSCRRHESELRQKELARWQENNKNTAKQLICQGVPCVDGNCIDKSYELNSEIMEMVSKLYALSTAPDAKGNINNTSLFPGTPMHCAKKPAGYSNCCTISDKAILNNWGHNMGAHCTKDEKLLLENRRKNLCVHSGKSNNSGKFGQVKKHHYCCFGNLLNKTIQVQARKQLGKEFRDNIYNHCPGLTIAELMRVDFQQMDLSEAYADLIKKVKLPNIADVDGRVKGALPSMKTGDGNERNLENKKSGINSRQQGVLGDQSDY